MLCFKRIAGMCLLSVSLLAVTSCGVVQNGKLSYATEASDPLATYSQLGATDPVLDPSIFRQGSTYYAFSTDVAGFQGEGNIPIHCSQDRVNWTLCGSVFPQGIPTWVKQKVPGVLGLWAPDISFFNGEYHLYYNGSLLHTQETVIGLATNSTLDPSDPEYKWVDRGVVMESNPGDDFNALDPAILVDSDGSVWLTYGSYWSGIHQRQIDPANGMLLASNGTRYDLATRPGVPSNPIEGASLIRHGKYYYLFVSVDYCCEQNNAENNYKQAVGRSTSPHGPFVDEMGTPMMGGGGTVLLQGDGVWNAPGGGTAFFDSDSSESLIIFHAHNLAKNNTPYQWVKRITWANDWPVIGD
jgi:arabinan endo-1,5-alpha-L-arabinosidase